MRYAAGRSFEKTNYGREFSQVHVTHYACEKGGLLQKKSLAAGEAF